MDIISKAVVASTIYEEQNNELKKIYLTSQIAKFGEIVSTLDGYNGYFGLGYPFYALGNKLAGNLPLIEEQFRYNLALLTTFHENFHMGVWPCEHCLKENLHDMPDLKKICYKCPDVPKELSPRKVLNRLPDLDLCVVMEDGKLEYAKKELVHLFDENGFQTSDIDPLETIERVHRIARDLQNGKMPTEYVPLDTHLFTRSELIKLMANVESKIDESFKTGKVPYLPTFPDSLRKTWQKDDTAINFIYDFLYTFAEYDLDSELSKQSKEVKKSLASKYTNEQLVKIIMDMSPECQVRRCACPTLILRLNERINTWREE